jgi:hypothetical protein
MLLHLAVQGRPVESENLSRLLFVPVRPLQSLEDGHFLNFGKRAMWRYHEIGRACGILADGFGQTATVTSVPATSRALDRVLELRMLPGQRLRMSRRYTDGASVLRSSDNAA